MPRTPYWLHHGIGDIEEVDVDLGVSPAWVGNEIVGKVVADVMAVARIVECLFHQRHANAHDDRARHLVALS